MRVIVTIVSETRQPNVRHKNNYNITPITIDYINTTAFMINAIAYNIFTIIIYSCTASRICNIAARACAGRTTMPNLKCFFPRFINLNKKKNVFYGLRRTSKMLTRHANQR